ncbi:galactose-6-phosphate isomerase subunit LacB [Staphylococcus debuckii]|uniref:Galactose-6-phosphate isomerase subunit LacB n=1 Tax=Staphylococcus debuckii TaxID=2044912 RepID=A0ABU9EZX7_9STAP
MKIAIGCDHIVTNIKAEVATYLKNNGHEVIDVGTYDYVRTHYPIYGTRIGELVTNGDVDFGVALCGTGVGISASADKVPGTRVALVRDATSARLAKSEYNCNIIAAGGMVTGVDLIKNIVDTFAETKYEPTPEKEALIKVMDESLKPEDVHYSHKMFDEYLNKWDNGEYHD